jgi:hypothetical protein
MNNLNAIKLAVEFLSESDEFKDISFIAILNWKSVPEAYTWNKTVILYGHKLSIYSLNSTQILHIDGVGLYQIM